MYQIKCDDFILYDHRDPSLIVENPKVKVSVNAVGEGSFTIYQNHPFYGELKPLKSIFEVSDEYGVLFRGRMTENSLDLYNTKAVDLEGLMAFFNDSVVAPFNFPEDFIEDEEYITASESGNVVEFFLKWLIENHNSQVKDFQKFKLGTVTVTDPNNYITRSESKYPNTWQTLEDKLFKSSLGGYLCIRYEADGNYIDYLSEFLETNPQGIKYGENMLDLSSDVIASETYSAIIPIGAEIEEEIESENALGETVTENVKRTITLAKYEDGFVADDIVKTTLPNGLIALYSVSAVEDYGWKCAPVEDTTFEDVTNEENLLVKSIRFLTDTALMLSNPIDFSAVDLHFSDAEIRSFRIYKNVNVDSTPHNINDLLPLESLDIELLNPQNTIITVGQIRKTLTDHNSELQSSTIERIEYIEKIIAENTESLDFVAQKLIVQGTTFEQTSQEFEFRVTELEISDSANQTRIEASESLIRQLSDSISTLVTDQKQYFKVVYNSETGKYEATEEEITGEVNTSETEEVTENNKKVFSYTDANGVTGYCVIIAKSSLMEQTSSGWTFSMGSIQNQLNSASASLNDLVEKYGSVEAVVEAIKKGLEDVAGKTEFVTIGTYTYTENGVTKTEPCVDLFESDTGFALKITNTQILFSDGSTIPTRIETDGLRTVNITVENDLRQTNEEVNGSFVWAVRSNGNYGLQWKEGEA